MPESFVPELARSLRSLGAGRTPCDHEAHDAIFGPLLDARTRAASDSQEKALAAFKGSSLFKRIEDATVDQARRGVTPDARARAFVAEAREALDPLHSALLALDESAAAAMTSTANWVSWIAALRAVFARADSACESLARLLARRDASRASGRWFSRKGDQ